VLAQLASKLHTPSLGDGKRAVRLSQLAGAGYHGGIRPGFVPTARGGRTRGLVTPLYRLPIARDDRHGGLLANNLAAHIAPGFAAVK